MNRIHDHSWPNSHIRTSSKVYSSMVNTKEKTLEYGEESSKAKLCSKFLLKCDYDIFFLPVKKDWFSAEIISLKIDSHQNTRRKITFLSYVTWIWNSFKKLFLKWMKSTVFRTLLKLCLKFIKSTLLWLESIKIRQNISVCF